MFLDPSKAFDTINHEILLSKLGKYGIIQNKLTLFTSYLTGLKQHCYFGGKNSKKQEVTCGISQGSCLGPLLFILYTNDFETFLSTFYPNMYTDDTSISSSSENLLQFLEDLKSELKRIMNWLRQTKLSLNVAKCEYMFLGNDKQLSKTSDIGNIKNDKDEIKKVKQTKYLGLTLEESLSWNQQCKIEKGKLKGGLNSIRKLRDILPQSQLFLVYQALVESHLRYGNLIWGHLSDKKLSALQKIHNRAFYLIESAPIKDETLTKRLSVEKIIKYDGATMVHKIIKEMCPELLIGKFIRRTQISKYDTSRTNGLQIPKLRLELSKKSFSYVGAKVWNDIPNDIRNLESTSLFKHNMKTYLLDQ